MVFGRFGGGKEQLRHYFFWRIDEYAVNIPFFYFIPLSVNVLLIKYLILPAPIGVWWWCEINQFPIDH